MSRLIRCVRSGPNRPLAAVPATAWQLMQAVVSKTCRPSRSLIRERRRLLLLLNPRDRIQRAVHGDAQQHLGVLGSAVLRALPQVDARLVRVNPRLVHAVRNQVRLAGQARNPEAVIRVGGQQRDECRRRVGRDR